MNDLGLWSYFFYDRQDRLVERGELLPDSSYSYRELQAVYRKSVINYLPVGKRKQHSKFRYGCYPKGEVHPFMAEQPVTDGGTICVFDTVPHLELSSEQTVACYRILGSNGAETWKKVTTYYDYRGRVIQVSSSQMGEDGCELVTRTSICYDFADNILAERVTVLRADTTVSCLETVYTYDDRSRFLGKKYLWNGTYRDSITYTYDEIGRLIEKRYGGTVHTNAERYTYNVRGWLISATHPAFGQTLHYTDGTGVPCYNGNISSMSWQSSADAQAKGYRFTYDGLNRLKDAVYGEGSQLSDNLNRFSEQVTDYDKNGNILGLLRYGKTSGNDYGLIDNLNLKYNGNRLRSVYDNATNTAFGNGMDFRNGVNEEIEYEYDKNGNLTKDLNKNIVDIQYNCINLPSRIEFGNGDVISYVYDANGTKLRTTHMMGNDTTVTDYIGNVVYENGELAKVLTEDGYITPANGQYHYFITDHQGNIRVVVNQDGKVEDQNDYYPFGGLMSSSTVNNFQPYKYNGKELDRSNGLNWYDYGARMYDPVLGRWNAVDPSGEKYYNWTLYGYCKNNPVLRIDLDGKDDYVLNRNGSVYLMRSTNSNFDILYASGINSSQKATEPQSGWPNIKVSDKAMLQNLLDRNNRGVCANDRKIFTTTEALFDAANIFLFVKEHTNVEWTLKGGYMDGKRTFILGTNNNPISVTSLYGLTKGKRAFFPSFSPAMDIHTHPENPFAASNDMKNAKYFDDVEYSILYKNHVIGYTDLNNNTYSIKVDSMKDLVNYILQQFK